MIQQKPHWVVHKMVCAPMIPDNIQSFSVGLFALESFADGLCSIVVNVRVIPFGVLHLRHQNDLHLPFELERVSLFKVFLMWKGRHESSLECNADYSQK